MLNEEQNTAKNEKEEAKEMAETLGRTLEVILTKSHERHLLVDFRTSIEFLIQFKKYFQQIATGTPEPLLYQEEEIAEHVDNICLLLATQLDGEALEDEEIFQALFGLQAI